MVRKSNFELLRIVSMLMIVGLHYFNANMGGSLGEQNPTEVNYYITYFLESLFIVGVNTFILITGYFQINKQSIKFNKVLNLLFIMVFYGAIFYSLALLLGWASFSWLGLLTELFPVLFDLKWFIKVYIVLYLLIPFINIGLNAMTKEIYKKFLIVSIFLFSIYPSFLPSPPVTDRGYGIITFVLVYAVGGYIKKHYEKNRSKNFYFAGYLLFATMTFAFAAGLDIVLGKGQAIVWGYNFIFNFLGSIFLFLFFSKLDIQSKIINYIAQFSLGVYFVHTSPITYDYLYGELLQTHSFWHSSLYIVHVIISILAVYAIATTIDIGRKYLFDNVGKVVVPYFEKHTPFLFKEIP